MTIEFSEQELDDIIAGLAAATVLMSPQHQATLIGRLRALLDKIQGEVVNPTGCPKCKDAFRLGKMAGIAYETANRHKRQKRSEPAIQ